ncbi:MAG TPA: class I SAM-dependent methyltransferase [Pseudolabrys sp.]|nr:class I SAM-dependent methyltransferase [Pseudolabrys sp.]
MSGFSAEWLALREQHDVRARNAAVFDAVVLWSSGKSSLDIVDLACGTGSTLRFLAPRLKSKQSWRLTDNDRALLARAAKTSLPPGVVSTTVSLDLNRKLEEALTGTVDLVTTSALLDLVSEDWLRQLARKLAARSAPVYAALSYDGRIEIEPVHSLDAAVIAAVNAHQRRDKGFGPALGPLAASSAIAQFESLGYDVIQGGSDWVTDSQDRDFQMEILAGWASAARELGGLPLADIDGWAAWRRDAVAAGRSSIRVGHVDFFAHPTAIR